MPALAAHDRSIAQTSASTAGGRAYASAHYLTRGPIGTFRRIPARLPDGRVEQRALPLMSRDRFLDRVREQRPATGAELAHGILYVDGELITDDEWRALLPRLGGARALVLDLRGYMTLTVFGVLGHFTDHGMMSPRFQVPLASPHQTTAYEESGRWPMHARLPRLRLPLVVLIDGRSMSRVETGLQLIVEGRLGTLVGETSTGSNGNVNVFALPGGFTVRFTGMRVPDAEGTGTVQVRGFTPEIVVHPTLAGVRAGRDEILEAGIAAAQKLAAQRE